MARTVKQAPREGAKYVVYYRVSDEKQGISRLGLDAQKYEVERYLAEVKGDAIATFTEIETGKLHGKRPQIRLAIAEAKRRKAILLIAKLDRLARNVAFTATLMDEVDFVALDVRHCNKFTIHIMAANAEWEGERISQRTRDALAACKREIDSNGFRISSRSGRRITKLGGPNWREALDKANQVRLGKLAAGVIDQIKNLHAGGKSLREIARVLNAQGLQTATRAAWHPSSVRRALLEAARSEPVTDSQEKI